MVWSFIIPAVAGAVASGIGSRNRSRQQNNQYNADRFAYEQDRIAREAAAEDSNRRRMSSLDFAQAVAQARGYNIPAAAFEALRSYQRVPVPMGQLPKPQSQGFGSSFLEGLLGTYSNYSLDRLRGRQNDPPRGGGGGVGAATGVMSGPVDFNADYAGGGRYRVPASVADLLELG